MTQLRPYKRNARTHSPKQVKQIASSIREFGFTNPVLIDRENTILAGHGRVEAAKLLSLNTVPALRVEHMSEAQKRAYVIADNKIALAEAPHRTPAEVQEPLVEQARKGSLRTAHGVTRATLDWFTQ